MKYSDPKHWHRAASIFPMIDADKMKELAADIKANGLLNPVVMYEGKVLDGRNRAAACESIKVVPSTVEWKPNGIGPTAWVLSQNLHRRHLDTGQKAAAAFKAIPLLAEEAKDRLKLSPGRGDAKRSVKNDLPFTESSSQPQVRAQVARQFNTSEGSIHAVKKIYEKSPETFEKVAAGELTIPEAQRQVGIKQELSNQVVKSITSSESHEWYTPVKYIEAARDVMGSIDLDPASCDVADKKVKASEFYTKEDNGLKQQWAGRVWLNPPYGDEGPKFVAKLLKEFQDGNVTEAILLVNPRTETAWFKPLFDHVICFTDHRLKFWKAGTEVSDSPTQGSAFVYLGKHNKKFYECFSKFGSIVRPY